MRQIMKRDLVEEEEKSEEDEPAEKRELNADALVVTEEVKKDALVRRRKTKRRRGGTLGKLATPQDFKVGGARSKYPVPTLVMKGGMNNTTVSLMRNTKMM